MAARTHRLACSSIRKGLHMARRHKQGSSYEPSEEMLERGRRFGAWFRAAATASGKNWRTIATIAEVSPQSIYAYRDDCVSYDGKFRQPSVEMIRALAEATGGDVASGLLAMGYNPEPLQKAAVPYSLRDIPERAQRAMAHFVKELTASEIAEVPIVGAVGAGPGELEFGAVSEKIEVLRSDLPGGDTRGLFAVRVSGSCLQGAHIVHGDILVCRPSETANVGDIVILRAGDEYIAKRFTRDEFGEYLEIEPVPGETYPVNGLPEGTTLVGVMVLLQRKPGAAGTFTY